MVTFTCVIENCANENVDYNFSGTPEWAECGGCQAILEPKDLRDDPPTIKLELGDLK
jgi:hypothetical protein